MPEEEQSKNNIPQVLRESISQAYLESITGDAWTRVSNTGALLDLLTAACNLQGFQQERDILFRAIETWHTSVDDVSKEPTQADAVIKCGRVTRAVSTMVFKYGKFNSNWFSSAADRSVKK